MKRSKKIIAACSLTVGIGVGAILFTPNGINASSNVVLASVDWVDSVVNPINTKVSTLTTNVTSLEGKINTLQQQINNLNGGTTPESPGIPSVVYVSKSSAAVHSGASTTYKLVATKSIGTSLPVIDSFSGSTGLWYRVSLSSTVKGWIYSGDISTTKVTVTNPTKVVTFGVVNLRKGASTGYAIVETVQKGVSLKYIQTFTNSAGEIWYNVESSSGKRGWISSSFGEVR
jgi:uncharacterized protein YgiM (DUF1202 family)